MTYRVYSGPPGTEAPAGCLAISGRPEAVNDPRYVHELANLLADGKPFISGRVVSPRFASIERLSDRDAAVKKTWVLEHIAGLTPGVHLLVTHCALAEPELGALHSPGSDTYRWAEEYRLSDQAIVTDPEIRKAIEERGIELVSMRNAFTD